MQSNVVRITLAALVPVFQLAVRIKTIAGTAKKAEYAMKPVLIRDVEKRSIQNPLDLAIIDRTMTAAL